MMKSNEEIKAEINRLERGVEKLIEELRERGNEEKINNKGMFMISDKDKFLQIKGLHKRIKTLMWVLGIDKLTHFKNEE